MNRNEAIETVGIEAVKRIERENCEPTGRVIVNLTEWSASIRLDGDRLLTAYYYTDEDDAETVEEAGGDWSVLSWEVERYEIE